MTHDEMMKTGTADLMIHIDQVQRDNEILKAELAEERALNLKLAEQGVIADNELAALRAQHQPLKPASAEDQAIYQSIADNYNKPTPSEAKDAARLDFLEQMAKASRTGVSLDWVKYVEDWAVKENGYRVCWHHHLGARAVSVRAAIDEAMDAL